jgi:sensor histidine kinase YesM
MANGGWLIELRKIRCRHVAIGFVVWTFIGLTFGSRTYLYYYRLGVEVSLAQMIASYLIDFYLWGLASPLVIILSRRFLIERNHLFSRISIHLLVSVVFSFIIVGLSAPPYWIMGLAELSKTPTFSSLFFKAISSPIGIHENVIVYWMTALAAHAFIYYQQARVRETEAIRLTAQSAQLSEQLLQAQLSALKMQLHPHFLFNTLNSIASLLHKDTETAHRMIARLSDFLRMTLKNSETHSVRLDKELEFLDNYLEIEKIRFQDRLVVEMRIEPEANEAQVPNLILQPLVENAVRHGLANVSSTGHLKISAQRQNGTVSIQIEDNGPGFDNNDVNRKRKRKTRGGVGLANTQARLEQFYGDDFSFKIADKSDSRGTVVSLEVPFRTNENNE